MLIKLFLLRVTLYITIETLLCVLLPFTFRKYCSRKNTIWLLIGSLFFSTFLHCSFLCTHNTTSKILLEAPSLMLKKNHINLFLNNETKENSSIYWQNKYNIPSNNSIVDWCWKLTKSYSIVIRNLLLEKIYYWVNMALSIVFPTIAMLLCTILIIQRFTFKVG